MSNIQLKAENKELKVRFDRTEEHMMSNLMSLVGPMNDNIRLRILLLA